MRRRQIEAARYEASKGVTIPDKPVGEPNVVAVTVVIEPPKKKGWPKGKPRKPKTE